MEKFREEALVLEQEMLQEGIYSIIIDTKDIAKASVPGQFVSVYSKDGSKLLPRPISICDTDGSKLRLVYRVVGFGTNEFSKLKKGDTVTIMGPLGNGFPIKEKNAVLVAGGIGIPPMLKLAKTIKEQYKDISVTTVLGYRDKNTFLDKEFEKYGEVVITTDDGSLGIHGNVIDAMKDKNIVPEVLYACGPTPMLRGIKAYSIEKDFEAYISLEEKMACGIGACLACVCQTKEKDEHSNVNNTRICKDGPVFNAREVEI